MFVVIWGISFIKKDNTLDDDLENEVLNEQEFIDNTVASNNFDQVFSTVEENIEKTSTPDDELIFVTSVLDNGDDTYTLSGIKYKKYILSQSELQYAIDDGEMIINDDIYKIIEVEENSFELYQEGREDICIYTIRLNKNDEYVLEANTELSECWRLSEDVCKVIVGKDVKVEDFNGDKVKASDVFADMGNAIPIETTHPDADRTFRFIIKNGKCTKIENILSST